MIITHSSSISARRKPRSFFGLIGVLVAVLFQLSPSVYSQSEASLDVSGGKKILVVGDSLSAAYKLPEEQGWVALMAKRLQEKGQPFDVVNASISGATTDVGLSVMRNALAVHKPQLVLLELGANDGLQGKPVNYITGNLEKLILMAKQADAEVILLGIKLPPNFGKRYTEPFFQQYSVLAERHKLPLLPFLLEGVAGNPELMLSDGLHPAVEGQEIILENVWPVLESVLVRSSKK